MTIRKGKTIIAGNSAMNIATSNKVGMVRPDGITISISNDGVIKSENTRLCMFDTVLKDHILTYKESKGLALQGTYVYKNAVAGSRYGYPDFYAKCLEEYSQATNTETVNGVTVKVHSNGHKFYDIADKEGIDTFFNSMGLAWMYGIDQENERIFLPRNNWFEQASVNGVGETVEAGLPNITSGDGTVENSISIPLWGSTQQEAGAIKTYSTTRKYSTGSGTSDVGYMTFDASRSNSIYGNSDTVQPPAVKKLLYICVGNTESQSAITDVVDVTTTENDTMPLFTGLYFDFKPNNVSWLKAGEQANSGGVYTFCYNELVKCLNEVDNIYNLKVINESDMIEGVDYSEYWKVNQENMTFITPTAISNKALSGAVAGNGMTLGLTNGTLNFGLQTSDAFTFVTNGNGDGYGSSVGTSVTKNTNTTTYSKTYGVTTDPTKSGIIAKEATAQLYFKVANSVQNLELLDAGKVMEEAVLRSSLVEAQVVIETYQNGTSWYRIWSDGWCEQGGSIISVAELNTVTLLKPYLEVGYTLLVVPHHNTTSAYLNRFGFNKTVNTFQYYSNANIVHDWQACGYIW